MSLRPGDRVDRYLIVARLGAGGMGEVYRAHDTRLQRDIALKILHSDPGSGSAPVTDGASRMLQEARNVAALAHPNVITIHDVGEVNEPQELRGQPYIAMELIEGRSLRDVITGPPEPLAERIGWLAAAALALHAAHARGIVHRDVKPENIMIGKDGVVKVLDFGIAKRSYKTNAVDPTSSTEAQLLPSRASSGLIIGTPYYMAPEQMRSDPLDGRADQFSWGVVAYELLAGKAPWGVEGDALKLVSEVLSRDPPSPGNWNPEIPPHVSAAILRALAKAPEARFASMTDLVAAITSRVSASAARDLRSDAAPAFAKTESLSPAAATMASVPPAPGPPPEMPAPGARTARRGRMLLGIAAVALGAVGVAVTVQRESRAPHAPSPSARAAAAEDAGFPDFGSSMSSVAVATEAYRSGVASFRDANRERANSYFDHAIEADPKFAAAHLRRALLYVPFGDHERDDFQEATRLRASLGAHDQALVEAFAPIASAPGDLAETGRRLAALAAKHPDDEDFSFQHCSVAIEVGDLDSGIAACTHAGALDPGAAAPLRERAKGQLLSGDMPGALTSFDACLRVSPLATLCLSTLFQLQAFGGQCDAALTTARRLVSADRTAAWNYQYLTEVLLGTGAPIESVKTAIAEEVERLPPSDATVQQESLGALSAIAFGQFPAAHARLVGWDHAVEAERSESERYPLDEARVILAIEEGRASEAATTASTYLRSQPGWALDDDIDRSIFFDGVLYRTGAISKDELVVRRTKWLAWSNARPRGNRYGNARGIAWIAAYAEPAKTAEDGQEALDALPAYLPLPDPLFWAPNFEEPIGRVYRLAGRDAEAATFLSRAAKSCAGLSSAIWVMWANVELGEVLEKTGDKVGACEAYGRVTARWSAAPTSRSARRAEVRRRVLGCGR